MLDLLPMSNPAVTISPVSNSRRTQETVGLVVALEGRINGEGLVALLSTQPDFRVLGLAATCAATVTLCASLRPDVLVLGIVGGWARELSPLRAIGLASPATRVLAFAPHGRDRCAHLNPHDPAAANDHSPPWIRHSTCLPRALALGALGAINADAAPERLFAAVRAVARGERWPAAASVNNDENGPSLSRQELRVARLIGEGASNKEIGDSLAISDLTVKKHVGNIFKKLGLHDRLQLGLCLARNPMVLDRERDESFD